MKRDLFKKAICVVMITVLCLGLLPVSPARAVTVTQNQKNMVARANYCYNMTWVAKQTVAGWGATFYKGNTYHIPYGQPIYSGQYIGYGATFEEFLSAAATAGSIFYTGRSWCDGTTAPYYATDCSSFVSWVWGINRTTTYYIPGVSTSLGYVTTARASSALQLGDALNSNAHVVLVSGLEYNSNGTIATIEITEQTPPQMKRTYHTPSSLASKYGSYTIQRYNGTVPPAPNSDDESPVISDVVYSELSASGYTISCTVTDNVGVSKVAFPTWTVRNEQDDLASNWMSTQLGTKSGNRYTFRVNASEHNNETGMYVTHIYAEDSQGNVGKLALDAIEVRNDYQNPVISDVTVSQLSSSGYTVTCKVTDDWGISNVCFPTWTLNNGQDDLIANWPTTQRGTKNGDYYTFRVNASDHNNESGSYVTHIYATDGAGNQVIATTETVEVRNDTRAPVIADVQVSNITAQGYTVSCKVTDDGGLSSVAFPTWTVANGQDDLPEYFMETQKGTQNGNIYTFQVRVSEHNYETGWYVTHIYARDYAGNETKFELDMVEVKDAAKGITLQSGSSYSRSDDLILGISAGTRVSNLLSNFENSGLQAVNAQGQSLSNTAVIGTGMTIDLYDGGMLVDSVTVVVSGDVDGNGDIDTTDYMRIKSAMLGGFSLDRAQEKAADVDGSHNLDNTDYLRIKSQFLGNYTI